MGLLSAAVTEICEVCLSHSSPASEHTHILTNTTTTVIMSWQSYVDDQLISTKMINNAVIAGHDGNIWAHSAGFPVSAEELKTLLTRYASTEELAMNGVTIAGTKYMFLSATDRVVRGKKGTSGVHCIKTVQALIVCVYEDPVVPEQAATVTEKLGEYLISVGY